MTVYRRTLSTGTLSVTPKPENTYSLDSLFDIAERQNPKRAFLFVSKVLGRHIPVPPTTMRRAYRDLAEQIPADIPQPVLFVGMAETAVGLAAGVHQEARKRFHGTVLLTSTRHPVDGELLCEFKETHSHATDHLIYWPSHPDHAEQVKRARTLILVDDEATTGNTFHHLTTALADAGLNTFERVVTVTLTDWSNGSLAHRDDAAFPDAPVSSIALAFGDWDWQATPDAPVPVMPEVNITARGSVDITGQQNWGRLGVQDSQCDLGHSIQAQPDEKILVLGTSEFIWQPFLLAERLQHDGAEVLFSTTTRSPISIGHAIQSAATFTDNYGLGIPNFSYNLAHQDVDRILVCCETPAHAIDPIFIDQLSQITPNIEVVTHD